MLATDGVCCNLWTISVVIAVDAGAQLRFN